MSEASLEQIKKAHAITPMSCVQSEYSIMCSKVEGALLDFCEAENIGFMAYLPMASGFLSGKYDKNTQYSGDDVRRVITRFEPSNVEKNQPLLDFLSHFTKTKNATLAQLALTFLLAKKPFVVPIPGMRSDERMKENFGAINLELSSNDMKILEQELDKITIYGDRKDRKSVV